MKNHYSQIFSILMKRRRKQESNRKTERGLPKVLNGAVRSLCEILARPYLSVISCAKDIGGW